MTEPVNPQTNDGLPDYRKTLNVPKPDVKNPDGLDTNPDSIPQRAGLPRREPQTLEFWNNQRVYEQSLRPTTGLGTFILHDGPPFSNGNIHIGHAFNKILKDVTVKYRSMQGYKAPYVPGWDNNGLPIEVLVAKEFRQKGLKPSRAEIRSRCREVAEQWYGVQKGQFERLGVRGDWSHPYLTMTKEMASQELEVFAELVEKGFIYRGLRPVYWSLVDETALADAEIEYADRTDPSIYVRFGLRSDPDGVFGPDADTDRCSTIIWTTTPWTIPANVAVAVGPEIDYAVVAHDGGQYLIAADRIGATMAAADWTGWTVVKTLPGRDLKNLIFEHPLFDRVSPVVLADYVTTGDGTGVVHTAPGHGKDDFATGQKYSLPTLQVLTGDGFFNEDAGPDFVGLPAMAYDQKSQTWQAGEGQEKVLARLTEAGALLARESIFHSYPHGWRSHDPLVYRATVQWFMSIDHHGHREKCLRAIDSVRWFPEESKHRITAMVAGRPDWCISRQRAWGVGIPVFYAQPSGTPLLTPQSVRIVRDFVRANGTDAWFDADAKDILPAGFAHPDTGETEFTKESDIFDVWFDSGSTCRTVLEQWPGLSYPADVYLEGGDQHRGWFNSSLMIGVATKGHAPYRQVVTNGWTLNEKGEKMSKSQMNGVAPEVVFEKYGADVLRLWVCASDYFNDVKVGDKILEQVSVSYRTLRNTLKYMLGNLYDFDPVLNAVAYDNLDELDRWALHRLNEVVRQCGTAYEVYEFPKVTQTLLTFCTTDMSAFYLDVLKDRLYAFGANSQTRRSAQTALFEIVSTLARLLAPILSFTAEEVWQKLKMPDKPTSVTLATMPMDRVGLRDRELEKRYLPILDARDQVNKALEGTKKRLEAAVTLTAAPEIFAALDPYLAQLPALFLVSQVTLRRSDASGLEVTNEGFSPGVKCARCWVAVADGGEDPAAFCALGCTRAWQKTVGGDTAARRLLP
jgi:isoleucyl-tRNA synthetase